MESRLEPSWGPKLWVIESLVKIMDQIESIQEIPIFPCFLKASQVFSVSFRPGMRREQTVAHAQRMHFEVETPRENCVALDVAYLNHTTFGDKALRSEIIGLFLSQLDGVQKNLMLPLDSKAWHYLTHTLKGAASAVGARQIVALAESWGPMSPPATQTARAQCENELCRALAAFRQAAAPLTA
jgi:hypothetical protein